ncbi:MAG TPA: type II toxin-antitoxin system RelE/ParE family toxin [Saprospiraceae bacterium]|nr:type II toxin-antitoxin system RelE/ParE family toxin [Saprospiraceae bacterium]
MARKIIWTNRANHRLNRVVAYLESEWGDKVTMEFVNQPFAIVEIISDQPEIGTLENKEKNIRGFLLSKHNRLFYRITEDELIILNIFDTRSGPGKKKF